MKPIRAIAILATFLLILTCTVQPVSAGVEPSPFKSKTVENKIRVARWQMVIMGCTLDHFKARLNEIGYKGSLMAAENQINILQSGVRNTLRALESAKGLYEQRRDGEDDYGIAEDLEDLSEYNEYLKDEVLGLENHPLLSEEAKMALRQLAGILFDIEDLIDNFLGGNVDEW
jgi:hypothetical protein